MMLIGLTGKAGSGKDYAASNLVSFTNSQTRIFAFADPLYQMVGALGLDVDYYRQRSNKETTTWINDKITFRQLMQTLGTEWGRNLIDVDLWIKVMQRKIDGCDSDTMIVVTDVRFENEAALIRDNGGIVVRIIADCDNPYATKTMHCSEDMNFEADIIVHNDYSPEFSLKLENLYKSILHGEQMN